MNQNISSPNAEDNPNSEIIENSTDSQVDQSKTDQGTPSPPSNNAKIKILIVIIILLLLSLIAFGLWKAYQPKLIELQGRVEAETVHISTKVPSRIEEFYVTDGQPVKKDKLLFVS